MVKRLKVLSWLMVFAMMFSICSCSKTGTRTETEDLEEIEESEEAKPLDRLGENSTGNIKELYSVLFDVIDKDEAYAEKALGELFGGELSPTSVVDRKLIKTYSYHDPIIICGSEFTSLSVIVDGKTDLVETIYLTHNPKTDEAGSEVYKTFKQGFEEIYGLKAEIDKDSVAGYHLLAAYYYPQDFVSSVTLRTYTYDKTQNYLQIHVSKYTEIS